MALPPPNEQSCVVITGASSGIGEALARELAGRGYNLVLMARRIDRLRDLARDLEEHGVRVLPVMADLTDDEALREALQEVEACGLAVVGLCNNAGIGGFGHFAEADPDDARRLVALNVVGVHELTLAVLPGMVERGEGAILNVSSILGESPLPNHASYAASKAFISTLSEAIHEELRGTGVSCTVLVPGPVRTDAFEAAGNGDLADLPLDPFWHEPEDVAREGVRAMIDGRRTVVPGLFNQLYATGARYLPRSVTLPVAKALGAGERLPDLLRALRLA